MGIGIMIPGAHFTDERYIVGKVKIPEKPVPECEHVYDNDCDATCNLCGATRTVAHSYDEGVVTKAPNCTEDGVLTYTCTICGATKTEVIPATGHTYVDGACTACGKHSPDNPYLIADYPVYDTSLKGLYDLGSGEDGTNDSLVNHAPLDENGEQANTADEALQGNCTPYEDYITFSDATNTNRMLTYLRLPRDNGLTYIVLFRVPSGSRVLIGNRSGTDGTAGYGVNLLNTGVEFGGDSALKAEDFSAINSNNNFAILAMTANNETLRVVRYANGVLNEQYKFEGLINKWATGASGNAVVIGGHGKPVNAKDTADISLAAIHEGVLTDGQLERVCQFVKDYGEQKGLTIE